MREQQSAPQPNFTGRQGGPGAHLLIEKPHLKDAKGTVKRIGKYLFSKLHIVIAAAICSLAATIITIVGTRLNGYAIDSFIKSKDIYGLAKICIIMVFMYIVNMSAAYFQNALMIKVAQQTSADIRRDLFASLQHLPLKYYDSHSSGDLMSRLTNDVDNINTTLSQSVVQLFTSAASIIGMLIAMLHLSPFLTLISLVTIPFTFIATRAIAKCSQGFFITQQKELGRLNGYAEEMISGQKVVKIFSHEQAVQNEFEKINGRFISSAFKSQAISGLMGPCNNMINNLSYLFVSVAGGILIIKGIGLMTVGVVFSFLLYMRNFTNPINNILNLFNSIQLAIASAERVFEVIDEMPEQDCDNASPAGEILGNIVMRRIDFSYTPNKPVLKNANISALPGQTIAIVGPTGAGKTTIINLLTRFYDIDSGEILIDGKNISEITRGSLRRSVSMVLQDTFLFSDTVRENIRYGRIAATDQEVEEAARQAHAHEFIMQLENGYDTVLSDNGQNLSQGQRQLLSIARAIISKASVLILDEATSSIDTRTELLIQNALLKLMHGKTCFVIAHRLSTIKNADNILVIDNGRIVEQGTHNELISAGGFYASLYNSQFKTGMAV
ncbi:MAG TPA: multidrug ABC transporter ATP-binding protein [Ruminococcaceae bacterium]|nr:multidrug ABC transporter ATP-binding protein [Oscillospiraceae bacterium]